MVETVQVRWCPRCRAWGKAQRVLIDPSRAFIASRECAPVAFDYVREEFRCGACTGDFSSTRITNCKPEYVWSARNVLAKLYTLDEQARQNRAIPMSWDGHPELSDFSGALPVRPYLN